MNLQRAVIGHRKRDGWDKKMVGYRKEWAETKFKVN